MKPKYHIQTYGCQMNVHDSERMAGMLDDLGYETTDAPETADIILLNTCAVREKPEHKLYSELGIFRKLKVNNPNLIIGVTGCMAQRDANAIRARVPEVDILLGPRNIHHLSRLVNQHKSTFTDKHGKSTFEPGLDLQSDPTPVTSVKRTSSVSAYVDVIFGCNFKCTYCAVPSARGKEVSRNPQEVLDEIRKLNNLGYREITLLGQTVNAYGHDLEKLQDGSRIDFAWLLEAINDINPNFRVRFTSPHPMYFSDRLLDTIAALPSVCEHLHLPLQSGDNDCLSRMKRTYTIEKYRGIIDNLREKIPGVAVTTDVIVGFCGETDAEFANTLKTFRETRFDLAFMFAYSPRHSTVAGEWPDDVPANVKSTRLNELIAMQNNISREINHELMGNVFEVLVESVSDRDQALLFGRTRSNKMLLFDGDLETYPVGSLVQVHAREALLRGFQGDVVEIASRPSPRRIMPLNILSG
ncbi:MAG: tRNA (N6-isopentenyl adenosine(37)-C2)-methylthiotransferase MiaB [Abditibacteriaceae bacterium]